VDSAGWGKGIAIENPGRPAPWMVRLLRRVAAPIVRLCHRPTLEGVEHLPARGPYILVANHSGGMGVAEIFSFAVLYLEKVGPERPLAGFALPVGFHVFPVSAALRAVGAIPSTYAAANHALAIGVPFLVFPGGDHETLRPIWRANDVDFGGRTGFLRIAREHGVPVIPLGIRGGHMTAPVLFPSRLLAAILVVPGFLGLKRWGLSLLGLLVATAIACFAPWAWPYRVLAIWAWLASPFSFVAWIPWTVRMRIGAPMAPSDLFAGETTDQQLREALVRVQGAVQKLVDR
jgi:1-acyl-sn-glycerol-3-phosphate acyltransferase